MSAGRLPERLDGPAGLLLRRWTVADAEQIAEAVTRNIEHLRPWMPWIREEPMSLEARRGMLADWERDWSAGGDVALGIFVDGRIAGSSGFKRTLGPDGLEIGYWIDQGHLRRGIATASTRLLTDAAFALPGITHVEIHHDKANVASAGVPRKLGYRLVAEAPDPDPTAHAESGIECRWRMTAEEWRDLHPPPPGARLQA